jgi:outer membrane lipoprotein-sorting protein
MRKFRALSILMVGLSAGLTGCIKTTRLVTKTVAPEMYRSAPVEVLQKEVSERDAAIKTLRASVEMTYSTGGGRTGKVTEYTSFRGYIYVRKPRNLRVILQLPVIGSEAMDMVSNGEDFTLLIPPRHKAIVGTNTVTTPSKNALENLRPPVFFDSLLVPGVSAEEYAALNESTRILTVVGKKNEEMEEPDYDLAVMKQKEKDGKILQTLRVVHINRVNMLPYQQDIYNDNGQIVTQALYDDYKDVGGLQFPMLITIRRPLDEYSLKVQIRDLKLNETLDDDQFELKIPDGVVVQKMP